ncbi:SAC3 domain-containing protein 1-like [Octopus sinensis]|uniref:SAC3 domain-containing protein 1-like n=1 Tax=Octopus sinensis TaxID=2607531 RepID=A0A6P7SHY5_9MOLL|nr:SAC3 domain-containing protein 1-like [Octopus sinensis]
MGSEVRDYIVGTCLTMCPHKEIIFREKERLLHRFETKRDRDINGGILRAERSKMVKEYSRAAAGKAEHKPCQLRPAPVLQKTVKYLLSSLIETELKIGSCWLDIYEYVFDRLRAVRQDMIIQNIIGSPAIDILEKMVRFFVYSAYRLCDEKAGQKFDPVINNTHLLECFKRLLSLYEEGTLEICCNRVEFESLYQIINLGHSEALNHYYELDSEIRNKVPLKIAYQTSIAYHLNNYIRVLRQFQSFSDVISRCALHQHFLPVRKQALITMSVAYSSKQCRYPIYKLTRILNIDNDDLTKSLCRLHSVDIQDDMVVFKKGNYKCPEQKTLPMRCTSLDKLDENLISSILIGES